MLHRWCLETVMDSNLRTHTSVSGSIAFPQTPPCKYEWCHLQAGPRALTSLSNGFSSVPFHPQVWVLCPKAILKVTVPLRAQKSTRNTKSGRHEHQSTASPELEISKLLICNNSGFNIITHMTEWRLRHSDVLSLHTCKETAWYSAYKKCFLPMCRGGMFIHDLLATFFWVHPWWGRVSWEEIST